MSLVRNALANTDQLGAIDRDAEPHVRTRGDVVEAVRVDLADRQQAEQLLPDEETELIRTLATAAVIQRQVPAAHREALIEQVVADVSKSLRGRAGPLDQPLRDPLVFDIMVNAPGVIFVRRGSDPPVRLRDSFPDNDEVDAFVQRYAARAHRQFTPAEPTLDLQMPDGTRLNAVMYPIARDGTALTLRLHARFPEYEELLRDFGICPDGTEDWSHHLVRRRPRYPGSDATADDFLRWMIAAGARFTVIGGTGAGKTTLFNALLALVPPEERLIVIEDTREIRLSQPNTVHLETREHVPEGATTVNQYKLVENALRMYPTRLLLGEVRRGDVLLAWLRAALSGHPGSAFTFHATTVADFLTAATQELQLAMPGMTPELAMRNLAGAVQVVLRYAVHPEYGRRLVNEIAALDVADGKEPRITTLYRLTEPEPGHPALVSTGKTPPWLTPEGHLPI